MTRDEKGVFFKKQSITVSSKVLVLLKRLNTFVHDCNHNKPKINKGGFSKQLINCFINSCRSWVFIGTEFSNVGFFEEQEILNTYSGKG